MMKLKHIIPALVIAGVLLPGTAEAAKRRRAAKPKVTAEELMTQARQAFYDYDVDLANEKIAALRADYPYFGYAYFNSVDEAIPPVGLTFTMFRVMVFCGSYFILFFIVALLLVYRKNWIDKSRWFYWVAMLSVPVMWLCSQAGWAVAEVGRQPWTVQDLLPTVAGISANQLDSVIITFWIFAVVFALLLVAEVSIMVRFVEKKSKTDILAAGSK